MPSPPERVELSRNTRIEDFRGYYWLKEELQEFCREHGLSSSGGKREIADRIEYFLRTGKRKAPAQRESASSEAQRVNAAPSSALSMNTRAASGFRCTQQARDFFVRHLGAKFRFTVTLQEYIKAHPGVTFERIAEEWQRQEGLKRSGEFKTEISPQFEYNQFTRDFFADPKNKNKTRHDCIAAWNAVRARRGAHKYQPSGSGT